MLERFIVAGVDDCFNDFVGLHGKHGLNENAPRRAFLSRNLVSPNAVHLATICEEQQIGVCRRVQQSRDDVIFSDIGALNAATTPPLRLVGTCKHRLHVAVRREGYDDLLVGDEVLQ
ncbi:hypothetical protein BMS3Bbin02_01263 [bacterium BMS3Bbin02]|nr:hypothetical protein BMS3Bbin02_01263 [bacterium BMS3Bbin02]